MNKIRNLYAFGCSHTFGHSLPDCHGSDHPSKYSYANLVAQQLGYNCINKAAPGSSVKYSVHQLLKENITSDDVVLFQLSDYSRTCILDKEGQHIIMPNGSHKDKTSRIYYKNLYRDIDAKLVYADFAKLIRSYLESLQCKYIIYVLKKQDYFDGVSNLPYIRNPGYEYVDYADDNSHAGIKSHELFAEKILNIYRNG